MTALEMYQGIYDYLENLLRFSDSLTTLRSLDEIDGCERFLRAPHHRHDPDQAKWFTKEISKLPPFVPLLTTDLEQREQNVTTPKLVNEMAFAASNEVNRGLTTL